MFKSINDSLLTLLFSLLVIIVTLSLISCSQSRITHVTLTSIEIAPLLNNVPTGTNTQLTATGFYDNGEKKVVTSTVEWGSSNTDVFSISSSGVLQSLSVGTSTITAKIETTTASIKLNVSPAKLLSLNINPPNPQIYIDTQKTLSVFGIYDDGSKTNLTDNVTWSSESNSLFTHNKNIVTGKNTGTASIVASLQSISASTLITVTNASLLKISFDLGSTTFFSGNDIKLQATGIFSDGKKQDISQQVNWSYSASSNLINVSQQDDFLNADSPGKVTITATLNGISTSETITIKQPELLSMEISSSQKNITAGESLQLQAFGFYADGKSINISSTVRWASSDQGIINISNAINFEGQAISKKIGAAIITATFNEYSASTTIKVSPATLTRIDITLQQQDMAKGTSIPLIATGIYTDNTTRNISNSVTWVSEDTNIIHVNNLTGNSGLAIGINVGTTKIFANLNNVTSNAQITVTEATLVDIVIENLPPELIIDSNISLQAIGIFSDGSKQILTDQVIWISSQLGIASVSNNSNTTGELNAKKIGDTTISVSFNDITVNTLIKINDATLTSIALTPTNKTLAAGTSLQLQATGILSNGNSQILTNIVNWQSSTPSIATVNNSRNYQGLNKDLDKGLVTGLQNGESIISASFNGIMTSTTITVSSATLLKIEISPQNSKIANDTKLVLNAIGIYSNGAAQDITNDVLWQSDNDDVAFISNATDTIGFAYSLSQGIATISATLPLNPAITGATNIEVNEKSLDSITILFEGSSVLAAGNEVILTATGNYSDGSTLDISNQVTWQSSDKNICTVSTSGKSYGLLKAASAGNCNISAKLVTAQQGKLNTFLFTISDATLDSISISPSSTSLSQGNRLQLIATGIYSDTTTSNISNQVNWSSSNTTLVSFLNENNSNNTSGLILAEEAGEVIITASYNGKSANSTLTINNATLESITVTEIVTGDFNLGTSKSFIATGTYSDQSTQDITQQVLWSSSDTSIATVSNVNESMGQVTSINFGTSTLRASLNDITSNEINIEILDAPQSPISISVKATPFIILNDGNDISSIVLNVQAADSASIVNNGTEIQLSIIQGEGILSTNSLTTIDGSVTFTLTSLTKGLVKIKATIPGTEILNYISVYITENFADIIARYGYANGAIENGLVAINSNIGFLIINYANRPFVINGFRIINDGNIVDETADPAILNENLLPAGGNILITYTSTQVLSNSYIAAYYLTEPNTGQQFTIAAGFTFQEAQATQ